MEQCSKCEDDVRGHILNWRDDVFVLSCPSRTSIVLGPYYDAAREALLRRVSPATSVALWSEFALEVGSVTPEQKVFRVRGKIHSPGAECSMCPAGWPVPCVDHGGGCTGQIHGTLTDVRKGVTYYGDELPERVRVLHAYTNAGYRRYDGALVLTARCDTCASPSGPAERSEAKRRLAASPGG